MSADKGNVAEVWGFFGTDNPQCKLAEQYSRYIQEFISLQRKLRNSNVRVHTRLERLWDLKLRLIPGVEAQLQR